MPEVPVVLDDALAADLLKRAEARQKTWFMSFLTWTFWHWLFAGGTVIAAIIASSQAVSPGTGRLCALGAAISGALLSLLNPQRRAGGYIAAWTELDLALDRFRYESQSAAIISDAKARGEAMIRGGEIPAGQTPPRKPRQPGGVA